MFAPLLKQRGNSSAIRSSRVASAQPGRAPAAATVQLSRLIGQAKVQPKLKVGPANDRYEQEAERMAEQVTSVVPPAPVPIPYPASGTSGAGKSTAARVKFSKKLSFSTPLSVSETDLSVGKEAGVQNYLQPSEEEEVAQPKVQRQVEEEEEELVQPSLQRQVEEEEETLQTKAEYASSGSVPAAVESALRSSKSGGVPLSSAVQRRMGGRFGADFSSVRVHNDGTSAQMNRSIGAKAFTHGNHIYFNSGSYNPESVSGRRLLAHELTHVLQQGAAPRQPQVQRAPEQLQRFAGMIRSRLAALAGHLPGYRLLSVVIGRDPISGAAVSRTAGNLVGGLLGLIPFGTLLYNKLQATGTIDRALAFLRGELARFNLSPARLRQTIQSARDEMEFLRLDAFSYNLAVLRRHIGRLIGDLLRFVRSLVGQLLGMVKEVLLRQLTRFAGRLPGFTLLTVILGRNPFSGEAVSRTATNLLRGFLEFVPGGAETFRNLQASGALERAFVWIGERLTQFSEIIAVVRVAFGRLWRSFSINDLLNPLGVFRRIVELFRNPVRRVVGFAATVGRKILEFIFAGVMGAGGARILAILRQAGGTFMTIVRDPVAFIGNLIRALRRGFRQFSRNILDHLRTGLLGWLFGALQGAGLQLPERFDLRGILSLVLQVLGLTYERIRPRLVRLLGERGVVFLERSFAFLRRLVIEGPIAAWRQILQFAGNIRERIMAAIRNFVITRIVRAAVVRLVSMFNPAGAALQAILAIYNTLRFFIERINQILALVESVTRSISRIAAGAIGAAADFVEQSMARTLPLIISFLARLLGLGGISTTIRNIIRRIRRPIDRALDRIIALLVRQARRLLARGRSAVGRAAGAVRNFLFPRHRFSAAGEAHTLQVNDSGGQPRLMIASTPQPIEQFLNSYAQNNRLNAVKLRKLNDARGLLSSQVNPLLRQLKQAQQRSAPQTEIDGLNRQLLQKEVQLSELLRQIIGSEPLNVEQLEYHLEGLTGTYASMPKPRRDDMTADHQPQAAVLQWAADQTGLFSSGSPLRSRAANRAAAGYAINLQAGRHMAGRTYGGKGRGTKNEFISAYHSQTRSMTDPQQKRDKVVELLKSDLRADVAAMRSVANTDASYGDIDRLDASDRQKQELKRRVKDQILQGEERVAAQDLDRLKRA